MSIVSNDPSASSFLATAQLLADSERLTAEYERLQATRAGLDARIALLAKAEDVPRLHDEARAAVAAASTKLSEASAKAYEIVQQAEKNAAATLLAAQTQAAKAAEEAARLQQRAAQLESEATLKAEMHNRALDDVTRRSMLLADKEQELAEQLAQVVESKKLLAKRQKCVADVLRLINEMTAAEAE